MGVVVCAHARAHMCVCGWVNLRACECACASGCARALVRVGVSHARNEAYVISHIMTSHPTSLH